MQQAPPKKMEGLEGQIEHPEQDSRILGKSMNMLRLVMFWLAQFTLVDRQTQSYHFRGDPSGAGEVPNLRGATHDCEGKVTGETCNISAFHWMGHGMTMVRRAG